MSEFYVGQRVKVLRDFSAEGDKLVEGSVREVDNIDEKGNPILHGDTDTEIGWCKAFLRPIDPLVESILEIQEKNQ